MTYKSIEMEQLNSLLTKGQWDIHIVTDGIKIYIPDIIAEWDTFGICIFDGDIENVTIMSLAAENIVGAYTQNEGEIQTITVDVINGYMEFRRIAA